MYVHTQFLIHYTDTVIICVEESAQGEAVWNVRVKAEEQSNERKCEDKVRRTRPRR